MQENRFFLGTLGLMSCFTTFSSIGANPSATPKPNIIFILTDDQRWDAAGFAGNKIIQTPNLDALAQNGLYFRNTFATTAISCVSRASIFTGMHQMNHGIDDFSKTLSQEQFSHSYPVVLRENGYYTGFIGKFGVGNTNLAKDKFDFWRYCGHQGWYWPNGEIGKGKHLTAQQGDQAIEFLQTRDTSKPFCLSISFKAPHCQDEARARGGEEFPCDPRDEKLYEDVTIPLPQTASDEYYERFPEWFRYSQEKAKENEGRVRWRYRFSTNEQYQKTVKNYYRLISGVDREVGRILDELKKENILDNTVIIFMADNGFYLGEQGLAGKWFTNEESVRLPLVIFDPRLNAQQKGKTVKEIALNIDIAPTIMALAGIEQTPSMDGANLMSLVSDHPSHWRKDFYYEHTCNPKPVHIPCSEGVIGGDYKLSRYYDKNQEFFTLYHITDDPYEQTNLAEDPKYKRTMEKMLKRLDELKTKTRR